MAFDWITKDMLYWLGSTIAQAEVGLLAFGALVALWKTDRDEVVRKARRASPTPFDVMANRLLDTFGGGVPRGALGKATRVGIALNGLIRTALSALVMSIAVILLAEPSTDSASGLLQFVGFAALFLCVVAAGLSVRATLKLTRVAIYGE